MVNTLAGITAKVIATHRITTLVRFSGDEKGEVVLFLHGNGGTGLIWEEVMIALPPNFRGIAPDVRGFGESDPLKHTDATRGTKDFEDDAIALIDQLGIDKFHVVGHSANGATCMHLVMDHPERILSCTLVASISPFGTGSGTVDGKMIFPDCAGGGAAAIPEVFSEALRKKSRGNEPGSARAILNSLLFKPPFKYAREEGMIDVLFAMHQGEKGYPGDTVPSPNWPGLAPGKYGLINAISAKYARDISGLFKTGPPKPKILFIRGLHDTAVQDNAPLDIVAGAKLGMFPDFPPYPGEEVYPPQPVLSQIRYILQKYRESGGETEEVALDCGHFPSIERAEEVSALLNKQISKDSKVVS